MLGRFNSDTPLKLDLAAHLHFEAVAQGTPVPTFEPIAA